MNNRFKQIMQLSLIAVTVVATPGCNLESIKGFFAGSKAVSNQSSPASQEEALATFNGKTLISKEQFNDRLNQMLKAQGVVNMTAEQIPAQYKVAMLEQQVAVAVVREGWGSENKVEEQEEFKKKLQTQIDNIKEALVFEMYMKSLKDSVKKTDSELEAEARAEFEKNKKQYRKDPGGTSVKAVSFSSKEKAQAFYDKARSAVADFDKLAAKETSGKVRVFDRIDEDPSMAAAYKMQVPQVPAKIRQTALSGSKFPRVDIVSDSLETWVICVSRKEPVYHDFETIKADLKQKVEIAHWNETVMKGIEEIKAKGSLSINKAALEPASQPQTSVAGMQEVEPAA